MMTFPYHPRTITQLPVQLMLAFMSLAVICSVLLQAPAFGPATLVSSTSVAANLRLPLQFAPNVGQSDSAAHMLAAGPAGTLAFDPTGLTMALRPTGDQPVSSVRVQFAGAQAAAVTGGARAGTQRYYAGNQAESRTGVPTYATITYQALYPGIDLLYEGRDGALKGTYLVSAGSNPAQIRWSYAGATAMQLTAAGDLAIKLGHTTLTEAAPIAWQNINGQRVPVASRYQVDSHGQISFALGSYNPAYPLTIDPTISYSTFIGGASDDHGYAIAIDGAGNVIITGATYSTQFPGEIGSRNDTNMFVTKLNQAGTAVLYSTQIGGKDSDEGRAIAIDAQGNAWITGYTRSADFPTKNPINASLVGDGSDTDTIMVKLDPNGALLASTYLGENSNDSGNAIALDQQGNAYVAGAAYANYGDEAVVKKIAASGSNLIYKAFFGAAKAGSNNGTRVNGITVDDLGQAYLIGTTNTLELPVKNPLQATCKVIQYDECHDDEAFVLILNAAGNDLIYGTFLGGSASDEGKAIALDANKNIYVVGATFSQDFPLANAFIATKPGADNFQDAFVTKLSAAGDKLLYSTYFGATDWEDGTGLALDNTGNLYLVGQTNSKDLPLKDAVQTTLSGICLGSTDRFCYDAYVAKFDPSGQLLMSTYVGGSDDDNATGVALDKAGHLYVVGDAESYNFPTTNGAFQTGKARQDDAFVFKLGTGTGGGNNGGAHKIYTPLARR